MANILVTGTAGFIGFHLAGRLLRDGHRVVGYDALTDYYDPSLKAARHDILRQSNAFTAIIALLEDKEALRRAAELARPDVIVHLAAQAGVRYSIENPRAYIDSNLIGSYNVLEIARELMPHHLLIASTSSVYGANTEMPFKEEHKADLPITLYAATKKAVEAMSHAYSHLWSLPTTCFRFFTVYGPWGRPDMALFKFTRAILEGSPVEIYGNGEMKRDFTYIDDLIEGIVRLLEKPPSACADAQQPAAAPWRVVNIAGGAPIALLDFVKCIEDATGRVATKTMLPMQPGDMRATYADHHLLEEVTGYRPSTPIEVGVRSFVSWYRDYYRYPAYAL